MRLFALSDVGNVSRHSSPLFSLTDQLPEPLSGKKTAMQGSKNVKKKRPFTFRVFGPGFLKTGNNSRKRNQLVAKVDNHVGFIAADFAGPGLFLFFPGFAG